LWKIELAKNKKSKVKNQKAKVKKQKGYLLIFDFLLISYHFFTHAFCTPGLIVVRSSIFTGLPLSQLFLAAIPTRLDDSPWLCTQRSRGR